MSRLIDADELITILDEELQKDSSLSKALLVGFAKQILNDAPTIDAVEVVRCKECIHDDECRIQDYLWAYDDFCSRGERR